ncbi:hypothetical protein CRENBAI_010346, partial [Crenichthys baileyi]
MPIISNTNHDFSNLSVSDDSSLDRIFTEIPETETIKQGKIRLFPREEKKNVLSRKASLISGGGVAYRGPPAVKEKNYTRIEEVHEKERREEERRQRNAMQRVLVEETKYRKVMNWLRDMVENPQSGLPGKIFACFSVIMVAVTVVSLCISTMPDLRKEEDR